MSPMSLPRRIFNRALRPLMVRSYSFLTYRTYDMTFGQVLRDFRPDVIHAHDGVTFPTAARVAEEVGAKLILDNHELEAHRSPPLSALKRRQVESMERRVLPKADRTMTVTELAADYLASTYKIKRPVVVFNAPPARPGPAGKRWDVADREDVRSDLRLHPRDFLFVYTGNITLNRGLELAIIALSRLQGFSDPNGRFRRYRLAVVGKPQSEQDEVIRDLAATYGVPLHILEPVAPHRVASYISTANASIIPIMPVTLSYEYAMPNKLFEAMLSGNPIIASDLLEMGPFIHDNRLGLTYSADDPDDCAEKMMDLIARFPEFERSPERQRELEQAYAWEAQEQKLLEIYRDLFPDGKDGPRTTRDRNAPTA